MIIRSAPDTGREGRVGMCVCGGGGAECEQEHSFIQTGNVYISILKAYMFLIDLSEAEYL